jgi:hypothetical protein
MILRRAVKIETCVAVLLYEFGTSFSGSTPTSSSMALTGNDGGAVVIFVLYRSGRARKNHEQ